MKYFANVVVVASILALVCTSVAVVYADEGRCCNVDISSQCSGCQNFGVGWAAIGTNSLWECGDNEYDDGCTDEELVCASGNTPLTLHFGNCSGAVVGSVSAPWTVKGPGCGFEESNSCD